MPLIVKMIILELALPLSASAANRTKRLAHLTFSSTMQLINDISNDLQKLFRYFCGTVIIVFLKIPIAPSENMFPKSWDFYLKDLIY